MKFTKIVFPLLLLIFLISCGQDCEFTTLEEIIVGSWEVSSLGQTTGQIEFLENGTLLDPDDALLGVEGEMDIKTYTLNGDQSISATAEASGITLTFDFEVLSYDCDKITVDILFGITGELKRI